MATFTKTLCGLQLLLGAGMVCGCGSGGSFPDAREIDAPPPNGKLGLSWKVIATNGGAELQCRDINANSVIATVQNTDASDGRNESFGCGEKMGDVEVPPGNYRVQLALTGPDGDIVVNPFVANLKVKPNETTIVAEQSLAVNAVGGLKFTLASRPGGNCAAAAQNGAGISDMRVELRNNTTLACIPATFEVAAGSSVPARTIVNDCVTPTVVPCLDADQNITLSDRPSGQYRIAIFGRIAAADCFTAEQQVLVPTGGMVRTLAINLAATGAAGCQ